MWQTPSPSESRPQRSPLELDRVHYENPLARDILGLSLLRQLDGVLAEEPLVVCCIGTDRSTGDSLGPLVGSRMEANPDHSLIVYGTLDEPVHAANLCEWIQKIQLEHPRSPVIAIDACLGKKESVGYVSVKPGPLKPGTGVNKTLPQVGQLHLIGVVNVGGFMEYFVLQNTRLSLVVRMADVIADSLVWAAQQLRPRSPQLV